MRLADMAFRFPMTQHFRTMTIGIVVIIKLICGFAAFYRQAKLRKKRFAKIFRKVSSFIKISLDHL